jgi:protein disulfide-isomerase
MAMRKILLGLMGGWLAFQAGAAGEAGWLTVLDQPLAKAQSENKSILLFFTGSDWCGWCKKFDQEALSTSEFHEYAGKNLVLVEIDFPKQTPQNDAVKKANAAWQERFKVQSFPTLILMDNHCKVLGRQEGYTEGGARAFIEELEHWKANQILPGQASDTGVQWLTDLPQAQARAKSENKLVLLDFTGSDWCGWCIKLDQDTFSKPEFTDYARKNLVLVQLDFPDKKPQADALKQTNAALQKKYNVNGFPTLIAMKPDGTVVWTQTGYLEGGPPALIAKLEEAKKK